VKEYSQIQKSISLLMIPILLLNLSGCYTTKIISKTDLPLPDSDKFAYVVHSEKWKFLLEKSKISKGILSGKIEQTIPYKTFVAGKNIHLYLSSDSVIKIENGESLSIPINEVTKVEIQDIHGVGTFFIVIGSAIIFIFTVAFISFLLNPPEIDWGF